MITERTYQMRRWLFLGMLGAMLLLSCGLPALGLGVWALRAGGGPDETEAAPMLMYVDVTGNAAPNRAQSNQAAPLARLGYASETEAAAQCDRGRTVEPIYRQAQIVGWRCNLDLR